MMDRTDLLFLRSLLDAAILDGRPESRDRAIRAFLHFVNDCLPGESCRTSSIGDHPMTRPHLPTFYTLRVRCPACGGFRLQTRSSMENGDDTKTCYMRCHGCGATFYLVEDPDCDPRDILIVKHNNGIRGDAIVPHEARGRRHRD